MKYFVLLILSATLSLISCTAPSPSESSLLVNTWIFNGEKITTNKTGYVVTDTRYDKYKYMDLYNNGGGSLWGGAAILDGVVSWNEKAKILELQAKNDGGALLNVEKYDIDSVSALYLKMTYSETHSDTVIIKELLFKR
jgi:hypothetical protein